MPVSGSSCSQSCLNLTAPSSLSPNPLSHLQTASCPLVPGLTAATRSLTGQTKNNLTLTGKSGEGGKNRTTKKKKGTKIKVNEDLNSKLKSKLVVKVNEVNLKKSVNIMNYALYRLKRRLNKLQKHAYRSLTTMF